MIRCKPRKHTYRDAYDEAADDFEDALTPECVRALVAALNAAVAMREDMKHPDSGTDNWLPAMMLVDAFDRAMSALDADGGPI